MSETTGRRHTKTSFDSYVAGWAKEADWPSSEWDYTEWEECLYGWDAYKKKLDLQA